jgi:hypothetical protein
MEYGDTLRSIGLDSFETYRKSRLRRGFAMNRLSGSAENIQNHPDHFVAGLNGF